MKKQTAPKIFIMRRIDCSDKSGHKIVTLAGPFDALLAMLRPTLEWGATFEQLEGKLHINTNPTNAVSLLSNLRKAEENATDKGLSPIIWQLEKSN